MRRLSLSCVFSLSALMYLPLPGSSPLILIPQPSFPTRPGLSPCVKKVIDNYVLGSHIKPDPLALKDDQLRLEKEMYKQTINGAKVVYSLLSHSYSAIEKEESRETYQQYIQEVVTFFGVLGLIKHKISPHLCEPEDIRMTLQDTSERGKETFHWFLLHFEKLCAKTPSTHKNFFSQTSATNFNDRVKSVYQQITPRSNEGSPQPFLLPRAAQALTFARDAEEKLFLIFDGVPRPESVREFNMTNVAYHGARRVKSAVGSWLGYGQHKEQKVAGEYVPSFIVDQFETTIRHCIGGKEDQDTILTTHQRIFSMYAKLLEMEREFEGDKEKLIPIHASIELIQQACDNFDFASGNEVTLNFEEILLYSYLLSKYKECSPEVLILLNHLLEFQHLLYAYRKEMLTASTTQKIDTQILRNKIDEMCKDYKGRHPKNGEGQPSHYATGHEGLDVYIKGIFGCLEVLQQSKQCDKFLRCAPFFKASYHAPLLETLLRKQGDMSPLITSSAIPATDDFFN